MVIRREEGQGHQEGGGACGCSASRLRLRLSSSSSCSFVFTFVFDSTFVSASISSLFLPTQFDVFHLRLVGLFCRRRP